MDDRQLQWVHRNRTKYTGIRAGAIGPLLRELVDSPALRGPAWKRELVAVLNEYAGPELLDQAEIVNVRKGVLTFHVPDPAASYHLRLQWEQRLLQLLHARLPAAGIISVRFTAGTR